MQKEKEKKVTLSLSHEFCVKLRGEISRYGLKTIIREMVIDNQSEKTALKKAYISRECKKNAFKGKFLEACVDVVAAERTMVGPVLDLKKELGLVTM
ncbi:MAG: hypothetical protein MJ212_05290 [Alphaproteobacteria bacterium]|nr:hypothetical protein [Alphaproteobacteria bacterium]